MRDLWKALAMVALDTTLRNTVAGAVEFDSRPDLAAGLGQRPDLQALRLQNQPNLVALRDIDAAFRARGLVLPVYAIAELNRWFVDGKAEFIAALEELKNAVSGSAAAAGIAPSPGFLESIGALVSDPVLRDRFQKNETTLEGNGFNIAPAEAAALKSDFKTGLAADTAAAKIRSLGWSGVPCFSTLFAYSGMIHFNA
jgi:hypothetical protein